MIKQITEKRLLNIALFYLTRFEASEQKLRQMLERRIQKQALQGVEIPSETQKWIENVVRQTVSLGYVNNERYAEMQIRILCRQGKSAAFIRRKLNKDGIKDSMITYFLNGEEMTSDSERALLWLKRHKKGGYRSSESESAFQKDLAALGRQGFSYPIAKEALEKSYRENHQSFITPDLPEWE